MKKRTPDNSKNTGDTVLEKRTHNNRPQIYEQNPEFQSNLTKIRKFKKNLRTKKPKKNVTR